MKMMNPEKTEKNDPDRSRLVRVKITSTLPGARTVFIAGCFNHWYPEAITPDGAEYGRWENERVLFPGIYEYRLIVDGRWTHNPDACDYIPNIYGGCNSILQVIAHPTSIYSRDQTLTHTRESYHE